MFMFLFFTLVVAAVVQVAARGRSPRAHAIATLVGWSVVGLGVLVFLTLLIASTA